MALSLKRKITEYAGRYDVPGTIYWFDNDPAINIFIPDEPDFSWIKYYVLKGSGLYESYQAAGTVQAGVTGYPLQELYPNPILAMPIKFFIFDVTDLVNGLPVSRPFGETWVHEQASKILEMYFLGPLSYPNYTPGAAKWGRLELEPGTVLPTDAEGVCIKKAINYEGMNITQAFAKCNCSEILPPVKYLAGIENLIKTTNDTLFYAYEITMTLSKKPPPNGNGNGNDNGTTPEPKKSYNLYIALAIAAIFLLKGD
jgi:hypothetical protein